MNRKVNYNFPNPFNKKGSWLKGNLHTHSTESDGQMSAERLADRYRRCGYDFLAITDHNELTEVDKEDLMLLPGEEVDVGETDLDTNFHLVLIGTERRIGNSLSPQRTIEEAKCQGGEVILAHPNWSDLSTQEVCSLEGILGIEVFNTGCHLAGKGNSESHWNQLLGRGIRAWSFATDDSHQRINDHRPDDTCQAWIKVKVDRPGEKELLQAIRAGDFYSSHGPEIFDLRVEDDVVYVQTSPVEGISFVSKNGTGERWTAREGRKISRARFDLEDAERFVWVKCSDSRGRSAWTNPILL